MTYSEKLKDPRWQKKRLEILQRDEFKCCWCGDTKTTLHVHHNNYQQDPWDSDNSELFSLCDHCHLLFTSLSLKTEEIIAITKIEIANGNRSYMIAMKYPEGNALVFALYRKEDNLIIVETVLPDWHLPYLTQMINILDKCRASEL